MMHADRSSTLVAQRPSLNANPRPNVMQKADLRSLLHSVRPTADLARETDKLLEESNVPGAAPGVGLVVMNSSLLLLSCDHGAPARKSYFRFGPCVPVSEQFNLTIREKEALGHLLQGLTSKEIANRMNISPNTVKTFLRLIMIKMGVSTRCAILGKTVAATLQL